MSQSWRQQLQSITRDAQLRMVQSNRSQQDNKLGLKNTNKTRAKGKANVQSRNQFGQSTSFSCVPQSSAAVPWELQQQTLKKTHLVTTNKNKGKEDAIDCSQSLPFITMLPWGIPTKVLRGLGYSRAGSLGLSGSSIQLPDSVPLPPLSTQPVSFSTYQKNSPCFLARQDALQAMLAKQAIQVIPQQSVTLGFYSRTFIVPKRLQEKEKAKTYN